MDEPLVVAEIVDGKKLPLVPGCCWVLFILIYSSLGFLMGSARFTTRFALIW